jgi:hypothetical protein
VSVHSKMHGYRTTSSKSFKAFWILLGSTAIGLLLWYCFSKFGAIYGLQMVVELLRLAMPGQGSIDWPNTISAT